MTGKKLNHGRTGRRRPPPDDHTPIPGAEILEELTALRAIYEDDCEILSESPLQIKIKLRSYSEDSDVSAFLSVRFSPLYPKKSPELSIIPEKGLLKPDEDKLLFLLRNQADKYNNKKCGMIYELVEAAKEFLSNIVPFEQPHVPCATTEETVRPSEGPFVYGLIDLFTGSVTLELSVEENNKTKNTCLQLQDLDVMNDPSPERVNENTKKLAKIDSCVEEIKRSSDPLTSVSEESVENVSNREVGEYTEEEEEESEEEEEESDDDETESDHTEAVPWTSTNLNQTQKDLCLARMLQLACAYIGPPADAIPEVTSELVKLGIVSDQVADLAKDSSSQFNTNFSQAFGDRMIASKTSHYWKTVFDSSSTPSSRYLNDFEELEKLGHGGYGHVVLCKNKLDGRQYAVKKIHLKDKSQPLDDRILREVATLSRLQHQHVVRYYQAWSETGVAGDFADSDLGSQTTGFSRKDQTSTDVVEEDNEVGTYLYIQMEYCPRTLKQMFDTYYTLDKRRAWDLFRQIVEGLAHIHSQGIIHRDLTPQNIFFDAHDDIKIGDFGLAKFLRLEQDLDSGKATGVSSDGTSGIGTHFYTSPKVEERGRHVNEKADIYSLGIIFLELWHPFTTGMERHIVLTALKNEGELPLEWVSEFPKQASLIRRMVSSIPTDRPSATELLQDAFPPRMDLELLDNILQTMHTAEDATIYEKVVKAVFSAKNQEEYNADIPKFGSCIQQHTDVDTKMRDLAVEVSIEVFKSHCARHLEIIPMRLLQEALPFNRNSVQLLTSSGDMIELCHELRLPFVNWVVLNQKASLKRFEICYVYRRCIGHSLPNRYLQGDFDVIGGASSLTEAEVIKTSMDIITRFFKSESCDIHLNHGDLLEAMWSWIGIKAGDRYKVAELLSLLGSLRPQSPERETKWGIIRQQLRQELNMSLDVVNKLQIVESRFCGVVDQVLPRLTGALPDHSLTKKTFDELGQLFKYLRIWKVDKNVFIDPLMPPTEAYHKNIYFQIYLRKKNSFGSVIEGTLLAIGGRYDNLLHRMWESQHKSNPPGAVGTSLALETIIQHSSGPCRNISSTRVLVCSKGGSSALLEKRMQLVSELWKDSIKAEYVPILHPSLKEQYEYAQKHDIKCLVIISDTQKPKIRHLEHKKEKELSWELVTRFLSEAMASQFKDPSIWN